MSTAPTPNPSPDAVDARFRALAAVVPEDDWNKLVAHTTQAMMRRLATCGAVDGASTEALEAGLRLVGELLVDYTNVVLTSVAAGLEAQEAGA